jgi:hypothetical protein
LSHFTQNEKVRPDLNNKGSAEGYTRIREVD